MLFRAGNSNDFGLNFRDLFEFSVVAFFGGLVSALFGGWDMFSSFFPFHISNTRFLLDITLFEAVPLVEFSFFQTFFLRFLHSI